MNSTNCSNSHLGNSVVFLVLGVFLFAFSEALSLVSFKNGVTIVYR